MEGAETRTDGTDTGRMGERQAAKSEGWNKVIPDPTQSMKVASWG